MKKLLICALCALAACQSEQEKISKDVINDVTGKYNVVICHYSKVFAAREKSGKWHVFEADSALEQLYKTYLKTKQQTMKSKEPKSNTSGAGYKTNSHLPTSTPLMVNGIRVRDYQVGDIVNGTYIGDKAMFNDISGNNESFIGIGELNKLSGGKDTVIGIQETEQMKRIIKASNDRILK